jgi:hypothetical protein
MVRAIMIVEMLGKPAEHLTQMIEKHIGVLNQVKDITVHSIEISEPKSVEAVKGKIPPGFFSVFAEADFETDSMERLTQIMFDYMPSSVEIIEPDKLNVSSGEMTELMNNLCGRLHRYDELAKIAGAKIQFLSGEIQKANKMISDRDEKIKELSKKPVKKKTSTKKKAAPKKKAAKKSKK